MNTYSFLSSRILVMLSLILSINFSSCAVNTLNSDTIHLYSIGNSHTWDFRPADDFHSIAHSMAVEIINGWHINCSHNLNDIWKDPSQTCIELQGFGNFRTAIENFKWDFITLQPFIRTTGKIEKDATLKFIEFIEQSINSAAIIYIYCTWPKNTADTLKKFNYSSAWLSGFDKSDTLLVENRNFFNYLEKELVNTYNDIQFIPLGEVLYQFDQEARKGNIPGFNGAGELYRDAWHLNNVGRFIAGLTVFSCLNDVNPLDIPEFKGYFVSDKWPSDRELDSILTEKIKEIIAVQLGY